MTTGSNELYPRTLYVWTKTDDSRLLKGIKAGHSVLDLAEELQREHISVIRRLDDLDLFTFVDGTEEWSEVMALCLGGIELQMALAWCNADPDRPTYSDIEQSLMVDFRPEFDLARELGIAVCNCRAMADLTWLAQQPASIRAGYASAARAVIDRFDMLTPTTLRNEVLGITPPFMKQERRYSAATTGKPRRAASGRRTSYRKRRAPSTTARTRPATRRYRTTRSS